MFKAIFFFFLLSSIRSVEATFAQASGNYVLTNYINAHTIPTALYTFESNGDKPGYPVTRIIENNNNYWVSSQPCSNTFKPSITYTYSKRVTLEAFLFNPAYSSGTDQRSFQGFPYQVNIYTSINNGPFELKVTFSGDIPTSLSWDTTQYVFPSKLTCDQMKIEFVSASPLVDFFQGEGQPYVSARMIRVLGDIYVNNLESKGVESPYNGNTYVNARLIPNTDFSYSTNAGSQNGKPLSQAFDNVPTTYWVSEAENNDTFKVSITIEFNEEKTIEGFLMDTAYRTTYPDTGTRRDFDGFPTQMNVYTSPTDAQSLALDNIFKGDPQFPWSRIQFIFDRPVQCRCLKLEWQNVTYDGSFGKKFTAVAGGILLLKYIEVPPPTPTPVATPHPTPTASPVPAYLNLVYEKASGDYANSNYVSKNKIQSSLFQVTSNGDKSGYPLSNAFDDKSNTFWVSSNPNTDTFKASVTFTFTKTVSLEAFLFNGAFRTNNTARNFDGFPLKVNFYASTGDEEPRIVSSFSHEIMYDMTWDLTQFVFMYPIRCDKIIVEFAEVTPCGSFNLNYVQQASACEMKFIGIIAPDLLAPASTSGSYNQPQYVASHRIPVTEFTYSSSGDKDGHPISYAFDRGSGTYWVSQTENSDTFKAHIDIVFNDVKSIDAILYDTAYRTRYPSTGTVRYFDGFPTTLKVYISLTNEDEYSLHTIFEGEPVFPWMRIQFVFKEPVNCRRIRLVFDNVTADGSFSNGKYHATAGDIIPLSNQIQPADPTASPKPTSTPTASAMATPTASQSPTPIATETPTPPPTFTPMATETPMATPTQSPFPTPTPSASPDPLHMTFEKASGVYADSNYINEHKISNSVFEYTSSGDRSGYPISNAFDGSGSSYWISSEPNTNTFKASVTLTFLKTVTLEAMLFNGAYRSRPPIRHFDGFPLKINFYASVGDEELKLVSVFSRDEIQTDLSWDLTQFVFAWPIRCDKLKIEFAEVTPNDSFNLAGAAQAAVGEMKFLGTVEPNHLELKGVEGIYSLDEYTESHIISTDNIRQYSSNGDLSGKPIGNAFDSDPSSYWVSSTETSDTFKSAITIEFKNIKTIDAILIDPAYRTRYPESGTVRYFDGFGRKLNIYSSYTSSENFLLDTIFEGDPLYPWTRIQLVFKNPIKVQRLKIEFENVTADESFSSGLKRAVVGSIIFVQDAAKPPPIPDQDGTVELAPGQCNQKYRCDQNITDQKIIILDIKKTNFNNYDNDKDGGAISLINCGFECQDTNYTECKSLKGGGAIFFYNKNNRENGLDLEYVNFNNCSAVFGGAAYVLSERATVIIRYCNFFGTKLLPKPEDSGEFYGGSALFLTMQFGDVHDLTFKSCQGTTVKAYPNYEYKPMAIKGTQKVVSIRRCRFEADQTTEASIYYVRTAGSTAQFNIVECEFTGILNDGCHFIDGRSVSNNSPKMLVSKCKFASSSTKAINMKNYDQFMTIDLKDQEFSETAVIESSKFKDWKFMLTTVAAPALAVILIIVIVVVIVIKKRKNNNTLDEVEMSVETSQDFTNNNFDQNSLKQSLI